VPSCRDTDPERACAADPPCRSCGIEQVACFRVRGAQTEPGEACLTSAPAQRRPGAIRSRAPPLPGDAEWNL